MVEKDEQISHRELLLIKTFDNSGIFNCLGFEGIFKKRLVLHINLLAHSGLI